MIVTGGALVALSGGVRGSLEATFATVSLAREFYAFWIVAMFWIALRARVSRRALIAWTMTMIVALWYAHRTPYNSRGYDWWGHDAYIDFIIDNGRLPPAGACWTCYHPPLYFLTGALFVRVFRAMPLGHPFESLQYVSTALYGLYLLACIKILKETLEEPGARALAFALVAAVPSSLTHSARIGNDEMLTCFWGFSLLYAIRWERTLVRDDLFLSALFVALGCATKGNALVPAAILVAVVVTNWFFRRDRRTDIVAALPAATLVLLAGVSFYVWWSHRYLFRAGVSANVRALALPLMVSPTWKHALTLEPVSFITAFANSMNDQGGRQHFWNFFLKTALMGEWAYPQRGALLAMGILAGALLLLLALFAVLAAVERRVWSLLPFSLGWTLLLSPACSLTHWYRTGFSSSGDARYVIPIWIAGAVAFVRLACAAREDGREWLASAARIVLLVMIASAIIFDAVLLLGI